MTDLKTRLLPLFRRSSASPAKSSAPSSIVSVEGRRNRSRTSLLLTPRGRRGSVAEAVREADESEAAISPTTPDLSGLPPSVINTLTEQREPRSSLSSRLAQDQKSTPAVTLEEATPDPLRPLNPSKAAEALQEAKVDEEGTTEQSPTQPTQGATKKQVTPQKNPTRSVRTLLEADSPHPHSAESSDYFGGPTSSSAGMQQRRKIWVKRPGASATLIQTNEDDLVDDVRDTILRKYTNSLGRTFDPPDVTLRIVPRDGTHRHGQGERKLGPEEPMARVIDQYYPGGQTVEEALLIDVPQRRTPRHSPKVHMPYYLNEDMRPVEHGADYFPPFPPGAPSPLHPSTQSAAGSHTGNSYVTQGMSLVNSGQVPPLPSPGGRGTRHANNRPKYNRTNTQSPTVASVTSQHLGKLSTIQLVYTYN
jgi:osomolarity two-component system response regulator SSK1